VAEGILGRLWGEKREKRAGRRMEGKERVREVDIK